MQATNRALFVATPVVETVPSPTPQILRVANTNGLGVYVRRTPSLDGTMRAYPDGTTLRVLGPDVYAGGVQWGYVVAPDGLEGYVPNDYVIPRA